MGSKNKKCTSCEQKKQHHIHHPITLYSRVIMDRLMQWIWGKKDQATCTKKNGWETRNIVIENYAWLGDEGDFEEFSPEFVCFGHRWRLCIHPGGAGEGAEKKAKDGFASLYLYHLTDESISLQYSLCVRNPSNKDYIIQKFAEGCMTFNDENEACGAHSFCKNKTLLNNLVYGSLIVEVQMKLTTKPRLTNAVFVPENPLSSNIQKMFLDENTADCLIEVVRELPTSPCKKAKIEPVKFPVHQLILKQCAPMLAELCSNSKPGVDGIPSVQISDIKPDALRSLLRYVYGGKVLYNSSNIKDIIDAADKYGIVNLKLEAESKYVKRTTISLENVMDNLLYADAKNLALLKELVMDYIVANKLEVLEEVSFKGAPGTPTLMKDVLSAVARETKDGAANSNRFSTMRISVLRKKLSKKGLDIDGSRETLIATLNKAYEEEDDAISLSRLVAQMEEEGEFDDSSSSGDDSDASSDSDV